MDRVVLREELVKDLSLGNALRDVLVNAHSSANASRLALLASLAIVLLGEAMILFVLLLWMQPRVQVRAAEIASIEVAHKSIEVAHTEIAYTEIRSATRYSLDEILDALRAVESGGEKDGGRNATGDGGRAIGPYQIHRVHWMDAGVPGRFEDCRDPSYARREVIAYWKRWCPGALESRDAEVLARVHNGGPKGMNKASTLAFWNRMQGLLEAVRARDDRAQKSSGAAPGLETCAHTTGEYRS